MNEKLLAISEKTCEEINESWIKNRDDEDDLRVPRALFWSIPDVENLLKEIGLDRYMNAVNVNNIHGQRLILMEASNLVKMGIRDFDHIKMITAAVRKHLTIEDPNYGRRISLPPRSDIGMYLEKKSETGRTNDIISYSMFVNETDGKIWQPPLANQGIYTNYRARGCETMYPI